MLLASGTMAQVNEDGQTQIGSLTMEYVTLWRDSDPEHTFKKSVFHVITFSTDDGKTTSSPMIFFVPKQHELPLPLCGNTVLRGSCGPDDAVEQVLTWLAEHAAHIIATDRVVVATN